MSSELKIEGKALGARRELEQLQRRVDHPEKAWRQVGAYLSREVIKQFATRGANFGTPWAPLAPATVRQKARLGYGRQMLVRTGTMRRHFTSRPMDLEQYFGKTAIFGSRGKIALWQAEGTYRGGRRHIPARPILKLTPTVRREIRKILASWVVKGQ